MGLITDNDIRRAMQRQGEAVFSLTAADIMTPHPAVILRPEQLAYEALRLMEDRPRPISVAPVLNESGIFLGMARVHDLVRAGI